MIDRAAKEPSNRDDRMELLGHLEALDGDGLSASLEAADLSVLSFMLGGTGMARRVLTIEEASRGLLERLPLEDPESIEDARTVRDSSVRAVSQMSRVLALVRTWLEAPPKDEEAAEKAIRELFHAFNNVLVGINCYAELLLLELRQGDPCHAELQTIYAQGEATSRLVRDRATLQMHLNELADCSDAELQGRQQQILRLLLDTLGVQVLLNEHGAIEIDSGNLEERYTSLPAAEGFVLREAVRRLTALSPDPA